MEITYLSIGQIAKKWKNMPKHEKTRIAQVHQTYPIGNTFDGLGNSIKFSN